MNKRLIFNHIVISKHIDCSFTLIEAKHQGYRCLIVMEQPVNSMFPCGLKFTLFKNRAVKAERQV